jgi:hypothetical protein
MQRAEGRRRAFSIFLQETYTIYYIKAALQHPFGEVKEGKQDQFGQVH